LSMVISPYSAALRPNTMPPCICASTWPVFTACPQSTAQTTRGTRTEPSASTDTSATSTHTVGPHSASAMPRLRPAGSGAPQPERVAAAGGRDLVEKTLGHEAVVRHTHRAPGAEGNGRQRQCELVDEQ